MSHGPADTDRETLREMQALLRVVATGAAPSRHDAVSYSRCRERMLQAKLDGLLPGFLVQCVSVHRFREFIMLYHPEAEARQGFVIRAFQRFRAAFDEDSDSDFLAGKRHSA